MPTSRALSNPSRTVPPDVGETGETGDLLDPTSPSGSSSALGGSATDHPLDSPVSHTNPAALIERTASLIGMGFHFVALTTERRPALKAGYTDRAVGDVTAESLRAVASPGQRWHNRPVVGVHLVLGPRSARAVEEGWLVAAALELEAAAVVDEEFLADWDTALDLYVSDELRVRLGLDGRGGWAEKTASGGLRVFFWVTVPGAAGADLRARWDDICGQLAARRAKRSGVMMAELLSQTAIVAPSEEICRDGVRRWEVWAGGPAQMPAVSVAELHTLAVLLDEVGDDDATANSRSNEQFSARTAKVRHIYNGKCGDSETLTLLTESGWRVVSGKAGEGEVGLVKPGSRSKRPHAHLGGERRPPGSVMVWTTAGPLEEGFWTGFDVLAHVRHDGSAVACAEALVAAGVVRIQPQVLSARTRPRIDPGKTPTDVLVGGIVTAIAQAPHPTVPGVPFVLMQTAMDATGTDRPVNPLSVNSDGTVRVWSDVSALVLANVQMTDTRGGNLRYLHNVDSAVRNAVEDTLRTDMALQTACHVADRPVLTRGGVVVDQPGWHPQEQALIAMPHRDRARWADGYHVPAHPTVGDVQQAADFLLDEILVDFPFDTEGDRARALACLISHAARDLTPTQPAFLLDAADRGSGKSLLAEVSRLVASGTTKALSVGYRRADDEENVKQVVGGALAGDLHLHIDELPRGKPIDSTFLSELVTSSGGVAKRVLGGNRIITLPPTTLTVAGNNAEVGADWTRRLLPVRLVHRGDGLVHSRGGFRHRDLLGWVAANRPRILAAIHTILLRSIQQRHEPVAGFGTFEAWSALVLGGLSDVNIGDLSAADLAVAGRDDWTSSHDDLTDQWGDLFAWWGRTVGAAWISAADLRKKSRSARPGPALPDSLGAFAGEGDAAAVRRWGRALQGIADTSVVHGGQIYRLRKQERGKRGNAYSLTTTPAQPDKGDRAAEAGSKKASAAAKTTRTTSTRPKKAPVVAASRSTPSESATHATSTDQPEAHPDPAAWEEI